MDATASLYVVRSLFKADWTFGDCKTSRSISASAGFNTSGDPAPKLPYLAAAAGCDGNSSNTLLNPATVERNSARDDGCASSAETSIGEAISLWIRECEWTAFAMSIRQIKKIRMGHSYFFENPIQRSDNTGVRDRLTNLRVRLRQGEGLKALLAFGAKAIAGMVKTAAEIVKEYASFMVMNSVVMNASSSYEDVSELVVVVQSLIATVRLPVCTDTGLSYCTSDNMNVVFDA